jgi:hypothetical protein
MNVVRAVSSEGFGRIKYNTEVRRKLESEPGFRSYFEQETNELPDFYQSQVKRDLGPLWHWLPPGAVCHDPNAYLKAVIDGERSLPHVPTNGNRPRAVAGKETVSRDSAR